MYGIPSSNQRSNPLTLALWILIASSSALDAKLIYESMPSKGYPQMHTLGKRCLAKKRSSWLHGRSEHFVLHGKDKALIAQVEREAEHAWFKLGYLLGLKSSGESPHIILISDRSTWQQVLALPSDGATKLAAQIDGTIFLLRTPDSPKLSTDLAHEIVHARMEAALPGTPLWLEEGLALQLGIDLTRAFHKTRGQLTEEKVAPPESASTNGPHITNCDAYPEELAAFYSACRQGVSAIYEETGERGLKNFVKAVVTDGRAWSEVLQTDFKVAKERIDAINKRMIMRIPEQ